MNGAQILLECLQNEQVKHLFGMPGGVLLALYDTFKDYPELEHILVRHEQAAAFAVDGYVRTSKKPAVCIGTSGPGATNLITGIASAHMDSVPLIAITGQVPAHLLGSDAFQEADIQGITIPVTKHSYLVTKATELPQVIKDSFYISFNGRPGPVHIDITKNVWTEEVEEWVYPEEPSKKLKVTAESDLDMDKINEAVDLINSAERPVLLVGQGIHFAGAEEELLKLLETVQIPVITTLLGLTCFSSDHPLFLGMMGMHGQVQTNYSVQHADVIIAVGMRFDDRVTGNLDDFAKNAKIIHIDIDPSEIGKNRFADVSILGDARKVLDTINHEIKPHSHTKWLAKINDWRDVHDMVKKCLCKKPKAGDLARPFDVIHAVSEVSQGDCIVVSDVGQHQMWTAQFFKFKNPNTFLNSGGLGSMGYSLPAAMGAKFANPEKEVWAICGDGGFQMNLQELITLTINKINLKIVIINNGFLGMVKQWQDFFFDKNHASTSLINPDFVKLAEASQVKGFRVNNYGELDKIIKQVKDYNNGPVLVDCRVVPEENVFPMVPSGAALHEMITGEEHYWDY